MSAPNRLAIALLGLSLAACTLHDVDKAPKPQVDIPEAFSSSGQGEADTANRCWEAFGDADLSKTVEATLAGNLDLKQAWARIKQMGAVLKASGAGWYPQLTAELGVGFSRNAMTIPNPMTGEDVTTVSERGSYQLGVTISYEVDLWGKVASTEDAAGAELTATREALEALAMVLAGQSAELWFGIVEARAQLKLLAQQLETSQTYLRLVELRFGQGFANSVAVYQQRQQVESLRAQVPLFQSRIKLFEHALATLAGRPPLAPVAASRDQLPQLPPLPATGLPTDLLQRRPDVRGAMVRIVAADHRVAAAIADQYPSLRLSIWAGVSSTDITTLFDAFLANLVSGLVAPLFDGFRRSAEVDRNKAAVEELVHAYGNVVLTALKEVEDALATERYQLEHVRVLETRLELAQQTLEESRVRYLNGLSDYLPVLTALSIVQQVELALISARKVLISNRIQLCKALGGGWTGDLMPDGLEDEADEKPDEPPPDEAPPEEAPKTEPAEPAGGER